VVVPAFTIEVPIDVSQRLEHLPELETLIETWHRDPTFKQHDGQLVSSAGGYGSSVQLRSVAWWIASAGARLGGRLQFDEPTFERTYLEIETQLRSPTLTQTTVSVVVGLGAPMLSVEVDSETEIDKLRDNEVAMAIEAGFLFAERGRAWTQGVSCVRVTRAFPKVFGTEPAAVDASLTPAGQKCSDVVTALRLHAAGRVSSSGVIQFGRFLMGAGGSSYTPGEPQFEWGANYRLEEGDLADVKNIFAMIGNEQVRQDRALDVGLRRFNYAAERRRAEDRIVDLLVAAEAVLLDEMDPFVQGELTFRLAIRGSHLLSDDPAARRKLLRQFVAAYAGRSAVVHGATDAEISKRLKKSIDVLCSETETNVRLLLRAILDRRFRGLALDWDELVSG